MPPTSKYPTLLRRSIDTVASRWRQRSDFPRSASMLKRRAHILLLTTALVGVLVTFPVDIAPPVVEKATAAAKTPRPVGRSGSWKLKFRDEFSGRSVNWRKWADKSSSQSDHGRGNKKNKQLEWNQRKNCSVSKGVLTQTAKRDNIKSPSGARYQWSSCLVTSTPSYAFRYGYIEIRAKLPKSRGFWPSFWTWQTSSNHRWTETDVYEFYSDNHKYLYMAQHSGRQSGCTLKKLKFNPTKKFHVYGAEIKPSGTVFYVDGKRVCSTKSTSTGPTNIVITNFVHSDTRPSSKAKGKHQIDYVRAWQRS